jgi:hypothetical protein
MSAPWYADTLHDFLHHDDHAIIGSLGAAAHGPVEQTQIEAWRQEIGILKKVLGKRPESPSLNQPGYIIFEYPIPRMGSRIDAVLLFPSVIVVIEFKVGERSVSSQARDQVWDYALDLKNFHEPSHTPPIAPVLVLTEAETSFKSERTLRRSSDGVFDPIPTSPAELPRVLELIRGGAEGTRSTLDTVEWQHGRYLPTPTIIEAARALYQGHSVAEISRSDAGAKNLHETTDAIAQIIADARARSRKALCLVTGVPGAGKTLIGLNIATLHLNTDSQLYSVFLSGNGPLVKVLQEALARDRVTRAREQGRTLRKGVAKSQVRAFIQNVHHYRDAYLEDPRAPADHVALFDEAQRAWNREQTQRFMEQKRNKPGFEMSEPEFLISCIDRHEDWGVIVCLVGGGQEINTGEAGIGEWLRAVERRFPHWHVHVSDRLTDSEYQASSELARLSQDGRATFKRDLHLGVSMRSFRAERVSELVRQVLDMEVEAARETLHSIRNDYPIAITRDLARARAWLRQQSRGSERYGVIASSHAERLKPLAVDVRTTVDPVHWFLAGKDDVRSSYYCEDVATEFQIQGLELDWACVAWDADLFPSGNAWVYRTFHGNRWKQVKKADRKRYLKNAYRVLLTRARQGMVIAVPPGDPEDPTRKAEWYDAVWDYLKQVGFPELPESARG